MIGAHRLIVLSALAGLWLLGCSAEDPPRQARAAETAPRIATLAPHLAELVYAAGAGDTLVGVSAFSNYPEAVKALPLVGDAFAVDREQLALLRPDLLLAWESGTPQHTVAELRGLGHRVEVVRTRRLEDVAAALRAIGRLTGRERVADAAARGFQAELARLQQEHRGTEPIRVFYQVSPQPLYTVNAGHYVSELIELCGGRNVFADLGKLAASVSEESVLARDPELLLAGRVDGYDDPFAQWQRWPEMAANRYGNAFYVPADLLARATPRLTQAAATICSGLEQGRLNRAVAMRR